MKKIITVFKISGLIALGAILYSCSSEDPSEQISKKSVPVSVTEAEAVYKSNVVTYSGNIVAETTSRIGTKIMGRIESLSWEEGDFVEEVEVLFTVENGELKARKARTESNLNKAKAHLDNVKTNYGRINRLHERGSATQKEKDDITAAYRSAQSQVEALESAVDEIDRMLSQSAIRAPYAGYITAKFMQLGDIASPGRPVVAMESFDKLKVEARVPESDVRKLSVSDTVTIQIKAADLTTQGRIAHINPSAQFSRTQYKMIIPLQLSDSLNTSVKTGMYANVSVRHKSDPKLVIPTDALVEKGQLKGVYTINGQNRVMLRWLRTASPVNAMNGKVEVLSGLKEGEQYINRYEGSLLEGQLVKIQNRN